MGKFLEKWPGRRMFVDMVLWNGVANGDVDMDDVQFDGVAGSNFDKAVRAAKEAGEGDRDLLINLALKLRVPVYGLEADGNFGAKWAEVVALCKGEPGDVWHVPVSASPMKEDDDNARAG